MAMAANSTRIVAATAIKTWTSPVNREIAKLRKLKPNSMRYSFCGPVKNFFCHRIIFIQILAHASILCALATKHKYCFHVFLHSCKAGSVGTESLGAGKAEILCFLFLVLLYKINRILNSYDRLRILYRYIKLIFDVIDDLE